MEEIFQENFCYHYDKILSLLNQFRLIILQLEIKSLLKAFFIKLFIVKNNNLIEILLTFLVIIYYFIHIHLFLSLSSFSMKLNQFLLHFFRYELRFLRYFEILWSLMLKNILFYLLMISALVILS